MYLCKPNVKDQRNWCKYLDSSQPSVPTQPKRYLFTRILTQDCRNTTISRAVGMVKKLTQL